MSVKELDVTDVIGSFGPWQMRIFLMCMQRGFFTAMHTLVLPLMSAKVPFQCFNSEENERNTTMEVFHGNTTVDHCYSRLNATLTQPCNHWIYDKSEYQSTIVTEWDLVCDKRWMLSLSQTIYMISMLVNVFIFGVLSDKIGRRPVLLMGVSMFGVGAVATIFAPSYLWFNVFRFILGGGAAAIQSTSYCTLMENVSPAYRMRVGVAFSYGWITGLIVLCGIAYFVRDWRHLQAAIAVPSLTLLVYFCFMPESPRWLLTQKRYEDARTVLEGALRVNRIKVDNMDANMQGLKAKILKDDRDSPSMLELFKTPQLRRNSFALFYSFFVVSVLYYALSLGIGDLGGSLHLNFFILSAIELPCYPLAYLSMRFMSRRNTTALFFAAAGFFCLLTIVAPRPTDGSASWLLITFSTLGKMFASSTFMLCIILSGEAFPTVLRAIGVATCWVFSRVGSAIAPFFSDLGRVTVYYVPYLLFGVLSLGAAASIFLIPSQIQDNNLADTIKEVADVSKRKPEEIGQVNSAFDVNGDNVKSL